MKILCFIVIACVMWETKAYPYAYPYYGSNLDSISYGSVDSSRGGVAMSRYYNPYYNRRGVGAGMAAFMFNPEEQYQPQTSQYYLPDRRRQTQPQLNYSPQQNEVYYPQVPESDPLPEQPALSDQPAVLPDLPVATEATDITEPTVKTELVTTTVKSVVIPELAESEPEPESEEVPKPAPKRRVTKKKQVKRPIDDDEEEGDDYPPRMPTGAYFPMFFGWGGRSGGGAPGGATAIANAFSTGRGGVATSHATAYGPPKDGKL